MSTVAIDRPSAGTNQHGSSPTPTRLDSLTGLRWFAASFIFLFHFSNEARFYGRADAITQMRHWFYGGPTAVSFFFVLSGFVLAWTLRASDSKTAFWRRRFARIYPSHFATFLVALALLSWLGQAFSWKATLANLTLTQAWFPNNGSIWYAYNGVSWSLSCEFFFYAMFPFVAHRLARTRSPRVWAVTGAVSCLFVLLLPAATGPLNNAFGWNQIYVVYTLPLFRLADFVLGICLALLVKDGRWRGPGLVVSLALCAFVLVWAQYQVPLKWERDAITVVPYCLLIAAAAKADLRGTWSPFRNRRLVYLGEISFCFYLVHELVIYLGDHVMLHNRPIATIPCLLVVFCTALVGAIVLHEFVEKPCVKLLSGPRRRPRPTAAVRVNGAGVDA